jgi:hypothetical protein
MPTRFNWLAIVGDTVRFVASDCGKPIARFEVKNAELARHLRREGPGEEVSTYHWLGAENG